MARAFFSLFNREKNSDIEQQSNKKANKKNSLTFPQKGRINTIEYIRVLSS